MKSGLIALLIVVGVTATGFFDQSQTSGEAREVKAMHLAEQTDHGELITYRAMPAYDMRMEQIEPFIFLNHFGPQVLPPNNDGLVFGPHPHCGFESVNVVINGDLVHKDEHGDSSKIEAGGVQWITAGKGLIHSEYTSKEFRQTGGDLEILQLWINLPSRLKTVEPEYVGLQREQLSALQFDTDKVKVHLIAGKWNGVHGPVRSPMDVTLSYIELDKGGTLQTLIQEDREILLYIVRGKVAVNGHTGEARTLVEFSHQGEEIYIRTLEDAVLLFGHAKPNNEPIVSRGPFIMNSEEAVETAVEIYWNGYFDGSEK